MNSIKSGLALGLVAVLAGSAFAKPAKDFKAWYRSMLPSMTKAMEKGDTGYFDRISTDDFTYKTLQGTQSKRQALEQMKMMYQPGMTIQYKFHPTIFHVKGDSAVVDGDQTMRILMRGKDHKRHVSVISSRTHEVWVMMGGKWKIRSIEESGTKMMDERKGGRSF